MGSSSLIEPSRIGDWIRISILGSGGFGIVSLWRSEASNDSIAVKKCKLQCSSSLTDKHRERWRNEVQIMKELNHPNIVKYKALPPFLEKELNKTNPSKLPLLSMEYCRKGNLRHILTQPSNMCGLREDTVKDVLSNISSALCYLHSINVTHRDIKPENIVLQDCENKVIYKLIDLGYAKELNDSTVSFVGTLYYLAPEIYDNKHYDCSVDYWSLGILAFEVICGVLPFPPRLSPPERYRLMKEKSPEQICVFTNRMGNVQYSSELFEENKICFRLKRDMEIWLRKVLQFDPRLRQDSRNVFEQLDCILKKRILKVFVVYEYRFYSYEFDEYTRLSTIRQWVARDTGITEEEQVLLGSFQFGGCDDETLIADCFIDENYELFLFKRNALFDIKKHYQPRLVKLMFEEAGALFNWHELKPIYSHCIHYIEQDIKLASAFAQAMDLYLNKFTIMVNDLEKKWELSRNNVMRLTGKVKEFNDKVKSQHLSNVDLSVAFKFLNLLYSIEKCLCDEHFLVVQMKKWLIKLRAMRTINLQVDIVKLPQLEEFLEKAVLCLQKTASEHCKDKMSCGEMLKIVCKVMKFKDSIFMNPNLKEYTRYLGKATDHLQTISSWIKSFDSHIDVLQGICDSVLIEAFTEFENIERFTTKTAISSNLLTEDEIERAKNLSSKFTKLVDDCMISYKNYRDEIESCFQDISTHL